MYFTKHDVFNFCHECCISIQFRFNGHFQKRNYELHANVYPGVFMSIISNIICTPSHKLKKCCTYLKNYIMVHCNITLLKSVNEIRNICYFFRCILMKRHILQFWYTLYLSIRIICARACVNTICAFMHGFSIFRISECRFNFLFVISYFRRDVNEICALLKSDAA
jgi:hypothetical protein